VAIAPTGNRDGDRGSQAFALQFLGWLQGWGERVHETIHLQEQAHELYVAVGDPFRAALVDQVLGIVYQALGEMERARLCTMRGFERARRYGASRILGLLHWNYGVMALAQGDWASSDSRLQQAWQEAETNNDARLKPVVLQAQAELQFRRGNWREAEQLFQANIQAASTTEWIASAMGLYGHFLAVTGRRKAAQEQLDRASACPEPPGLAGSFYIPFLAEGYIRLGVNERAAAYIERIRSMRGFMYYGNSVDRVLGVIATLAGDWEPEQRFRQIECTRACCRCGLCYQARYSLISPTAAAGRANQRVKARD
jgi:tetratricopeptide (TPR) repeat protein